MKVSGKGLNYLIILKQNRGRNWHEISRSVGIKYATLRNILYGHMQLSEENAKKLADYFEVDMKKFYE